jgi:S1-C subfamily serine protease
VERQLEAARERLEAAAREVAELTARAGGAPGRRIMFRQGGPAPRAMLGVQLDGTAAEGGARVADVSPGGAAAQAGIQPGDVIIALDGQDLAKAEDPAKLVVERMRTHQPETKLKVRVLRAGKPRDFELMPRRGPGVEREIEVNVRPGPEGQGGRIIERRIVRRGPGGEQVVEREDTLPGGPGMRWLERRDGEGPPPVVNFTLAGPGRALGDLELVTVTPRLGSYFGARTGVLVVRAGAPALKLEEGDVLQAIDSREPATAAHATRILRSYRPGETLTLKVLRDRKSQTLAVTLPGG